MVNVYLISSHVLNINDVSVRSIRHIGVVQTQLGEIAKVLGAVLLQLLLRLDGYCLAPSLSVNHGHSTAVHKSASYVPLLVQAPGQVAQLGVLVGLETVEGHILGLQSSSGIR